MTHVPVVDITDPSATSLEALDAACREHGFFLLRGHGRDDLVERMWQEAARFFDTAPAVRESVRRGEDTPFGYNDRELTKRKRDHKQVFDFGDPSDERMDEYNRWPDDLPGFRDLMAEFHESFGNLALETCALLSTTLGLAAPASEIITGATTSSTVRLNHYPVGDPVPDAERHGLADLGPTALGYHTDPGVLTLLLQDDVGGLQTRTRSGEWIDVAPEPGTIVVNLADAVQVWTNDQYLAAVHRVLPMTERRRFSIPYFFNPARRAMVEPIPELCEGSARYRPFSWREFMQARNDDNFADAGADDTQISHYAI